MAQKTVESDLEATSVQVSDIDISSLPEHERWLFENPEALASVKRGLADLAAGRVHRMSFAEYANIPIDDGDTDA